jgi:glycosyltransferase involved in cell wall biosynthesis
LPNEMHEQHIFVDTMNIRGQFRSSHQDAGGLPIPRQPNIALFDLLALKDESFVRAAYECILGRGPDPEGLRHYLEHLRVSGSKADIIYSLARSSEARRWDRMIDLSGQSTERFVEEAYRRVLGREADTAEKISSVERLQQGRSRRAVIGDLRKSPEAATAPMNVFRLALVRYTKAIRRARGPLGWYYTHRRLEARLEELDWLFCGNAEPRDCAISTGGTPSSPQAFNDLLALHDEAFVRAAYRTLLGREADNDGLRHYRARLWAGCGKAKIIWALTQSDEGRRKASFADLDHLPDIKFIDVAFSRVLGRKPDAEEHDHYLNLLKRTGRRDRVVHDLSHSEEALNSSGGQFLLALEDYLRRERLARGVLARFSATRRIERRLDEIDWILGRLGVQGASVREGQQAKPMTDRLSSRFIETVAGITAGVEPSESDIIALAAAVDENEREVRRLRGGGFFSADLVEGEAPKETAVTGIARDHRKVAQTTRIIHDSNHHWHDEAYYSLLGKIAGLMGRKKRKIKTIALYYWRLSDGGTERVTSRLATIWKSLGYRVLLLTDTHPTKLDYPCDPGVERFVLPSHRERFINRGTVLAQILRDGQVDAFITNLWVETATAWDLFVAKSLDIPVVIGWHNVFDAEIYSGQDIDIFRRRITAYQYADLVVALSKMDQYWFSTQKIAARLIHNPLTFSHMPEATSPLSSKIILWMARVEQHQKRIEHVIRMLPLVIQKVPDAILMVIGDGPDRKMAEKLTENLGITHNVRFVGYSTDVAQYIKNAAVHVMTSEVEGSPTVLSEVWAHGVPTVMYDLAFLEFLREGKGHIAVEQKNYEALGEEVARVLLDDTLRLRLGREARAIAQSFFDIDIAKEWQSVFDDLETKDDMAVRLTPADIASVAPIMAHHLVERMYAVDARAARAAREREAAPPRYLAPPKKPPLPQRLLQGSATWVVAMATATYDKRPGGIFAKLRTIDFAHIGLGDNLMAWAGLHALLINDVPVLAPGCTMYVPADLASLASAIFSRFGLRVEGVAPHSQVKAVSPVFSPLPPETLMEWYKTYIGIDWRMSCFEALDFQKSMPRLHFRDSPRIRLRLRLSERILYRRRDWQSAEADYIGYRLWRPVARKLGILPLPFLAMMKRALFSLRADVAKYIEESVAPGRETIPDTAVFPTGKSFQAFSPAACKALREQLPAEKTRFYIQSNDPWIDAYRAVGIEPMNLESIEDVFWVVKSARRVLTTDSFSSHVAQLLRDDFVLTLTRDFRENILHPGANPIIVANHPPCAPCNYHPRGGDQKCLAGFTHCIAFDSQKFIGEIVRTMRAFPETDAPAGVSIIPKDVSALEQKKHIA